MDQKLIKTIQNSLRSSSSTIMFIYLEELFKKSPQGFYKFHAPCKHPEYTAGTSILEETGWVGQTLHFRLSKICTLYRSKTLYEEAVDVIGLSGAFQQKPYLRYMDHNTHQVYYQREPRIVANIMNGVPLGPLPNAKYNNTTIPSLGGQSMNDLLFCA
jgi:hypothetical protein